MAVNWSKVLQALEESPGCVDEKQHTKFMDVILMKNVYIRQDGFYLDCNTGMEDLWMKDVKMTQHKELHKYALMQSKFWWNAPVKEYKTYNNAKDIIMSKFPYMTNDICDKIEKSRKFYNYRN